MTAAPTRHGKEVHRPALGGDHHENGRKAGDLSLCGDCHADDVAREEAAAEAAHLQAAPPSGPEAERDQEPSKLRGLFRRRTSRRLVPARRHGHTSPPPHLQYEQREAGFVNNDQISVHMVVLLLVGALTVALALYHPALGAAMASASSWSRCSTS
ncbi:hypothetical protein [Streptomyces sp. SudanB66_2053]|uniref:hypothetical protein n=1 Tax=Streptomyces sp. SudanB66_2053 TaxID=3035277 RepID=UPI003F56B613